MFDIVSFLFRLVLKNETVSVFKIKNVLGAFSANYIEIALKSVTLCLQLKVICAMLLATKIQRPFLNLLGMKATLNTWRSRNGFTALFVGYKYLLSFLISLLDYFCVLWLAGQSNFAVDFKSSNNRLDY